MKRVLLCSGLMLCALMSYSQTFVSASDSSFFSVDTGKTFSFYASNVRNYNSKCQNTLLDSKFVDRISGAAANTKHLYTYTKTGQTSVDILQTFDSAANSYTNSTRSTYTYNSLRQITSLRFDLWVDSMWMSSRYTIRNYNSANLLAERIVQIWAPEMQNYVNSSHFLFYYNANGQQVNNTIQSWDMDKMVWVNGSRSINNYDSKGYLASSSDDMWDVSTSLWTITDTITYHNNASGLPDSSRQTYPADGSYYQYYYTYYAGSSKPYQTLSYFYSNATLNGSTRITYFYDSTFQSHKDSVYSEYLYIPSNVYIPQFSWSSSRMFNTDGTVKQFDSIYYDINPNKNIFSTTRYNYVICTPALPVTLLSFSGELKNRDVVLHWATANETNAAYYTIQRSNDGSHFTDIGKVAAAGNSSSVKNYIHTDAAVALLNTPKAYYRLVQVDNNGKITYTNIISIDITNRKLVVTFSPNPVRDVLTIYTPFDLPDALIRITDMNGKVVYTLHQNIMADARIIINTSAFAKGMYIVTIQSSNDKQQFKIVK